MKELAIQRRAYSVTEAADVLGISRANAYLKCRSGELKAVRLGKRLLIPAVVIQRILTEREDTN